MEKISKTLFVKKGGKMTYKTFVRDVCDGDTAVLFIHGFLGSPKHFDVFAPCVPDNFAIYNILLDGHGGTVSDFSHTSMEKWKTQTYYVVDEILSKYKTLVIVAHSMGTFFAMNAAIKYPDRVKGIFLLGTPLKISVKLNAFSNTLKAFFDKIEKDDYIAEAYKNSHSVTLDKRIWLYAGWIPRYIELFKESWLWRDRIKNVEVPCYIFQSANDELVSMKSVKYIPHKDNISTKILKTSRHFMYSEEDLTEFSESLSDFLENKI